MGKQLITRLVAVVLVCILLVVFGFGERKDAINGTKSIYRTYYIGKFSKEVQQYELDGSINVYTEYWTQIASTVWMVKYINNEISDYTAPVDSIKWLTCSPPPIIYDYSEHEHFDCYKLKHTHEMQVFFDSGDSVRVTIDNYKKAIYRTDYNVSLKTFYGLCYEIEW